MGPVPGGAPGQLLPPLDKKDAGVADLADPLLDKLEALAEVVLVLFAVRESRAAIHTHTRYI